MTPFLPAMLLSVALIAGCAATPDSAGDASIENAVVARIAEEPRIGLAQLTVREAGGVVTIAGFVSSLEQMRLLDEIVADVESMDGVRRVESQVTTNSRS